MTREQLIHWQKRRQLGRLRYSALTGAVGFGPVAFLICQAFNFADTIGGAIAVTLAATVGGTLLASSLFSFNERVFLEEISKRGLKAESDLTKLPEEQPSKDT